MSMCVVLNICLADLCGIHLIRIYLNSLNRGRINVHLAECLRGNNLCAQLIQRWSVRV